MSTFLLSLSASVLVSIGGALRARRAAAAQRPGRPIGGGTRAPAGSTLWSTALSASLLLSLASLVVLMSPEGLRPGDLWTAGLCLAAGLLFVARLAWLMRRLHRAGGPAAGLAGTLLVAGPAGPLAAAWALGAARLSGRTEAAPAAPPAIHLAGPASASLRFEPLDLPRLPAASLSWQVPCLLLLCALFPPVVQTGELHWCLLGALPASASIALPWLAAEMAVIIALAIWRGLHRRI